jgi:hypothetical protein
MLKKMLAFISIALIPNAHSQNLVTSDSFQTPSGNIFCEIIASELRGDLMTQTNPRPPKPVSCPVDFGGAFAVESRGKASILCHGDTLYNQSYPKLPYGATWTKNGITCESKQTGLTCKNMMGKGFFLSKANQVLF